MSVPDIEDAMQRKPLLAKRTEPDSPVFADVGEELVELFTRISSAPPSPKHQRTHTDVEVESSAEQRAPPPFVPPACPVKFVKCFDPLKWLPPRPTADYWDPQLSALDVCVLDVDYAEMPTIEHEAMARIGVDEPPGVEVPVLRLFGATREGYSAVILARGFEPYIFATAPPEMLKDMEYDRTQFTPQALDAQPQAERQVAAMETQRVMLELFRVALNTELLGKLKANEKSRYPVKCLVRSVTLSRGKDMDGYQPHGEWFLRIGFCSPRLVTRARELLTAGQFSWAKTNKQRPSKPFEYRIYEANVPYALRFMIDVELFGCSWLSVPKDRYVRWAEDHDRETFCSIEVLCHYSSLVAHPPDDPAWGDLPPLRKLTLDIECAGDGRRFPVPFETETVQVKPDKSAAAADAPTTKQVPIPETGDPVICVAMRLTQEGGAGQYARDKTTRVIGDIIFTWGRTNVSQVPGCETLCFYALHRPQDADILGAARERGLPTGQSHLPSEKGDHYAYWTMSHEKMMLKSIRDFIVHVAQPHILSGYNVANFDLPYLINRAESLGIHEQFDRLGWTRTDRSKIKTRIFANKAYGNREVKEFRIGGRVVVDPFAVAIRDEKLRSYKLNFLAELFLKERKADVPYYMIKPLWNQTDETRRQVADYCWKDVDLADKLEQFRIMIVDKIEMARATGVPLEYILMRGQQIKVMSLLLRAGRKARILAPTNGKVEKNVSDEKYKGATVFDPKIGFYTKPVATLDFSSLYPAIMRWLNLCFTTRVRNEDRKRFSESDLYITPTETGETAFVKEHLARGLIPGILEMLTDKRNASKKLAAFHNPKDGKEPHKQKYNTFDRRQNALKVTSNSVYGFTGASAGMLPCTDIAKTVTSTGRIGIQLTARMVQEPYSDIPRKANETEEQFRRRRGELFPYVKGADESDSAFKARCLQLNNEYIQHRQGESEEQHKARCAAARAAYPIKRLEGETEEQHAARIAGSVEVIYGDTDSVMVHMRILNTVSDSIELGKAYAKWITMFYFDHPMQILFEKIYKPYLLIARKRYAGLLWTKPSEPDKKDTKGIESVRRDNCKMCSGAVDKLTDILLRKEDIASAIRHVHQLVEDIRNDRVDLSELVISQSLSKKPEDYYPTPPHAKLAMSKKLKGMYKMGDRVPYMIVARSGKLYKKSDKVAHPLWVLEQSLPIDKEYYVAKQLETACTRILEVVAPGVSARVFGTVSCTVHVEAAAEHMTSARKAAQLELPFEVHVPSEGLKRCTGLKPPEKRKTPGKSPLEKELEKVKKRITPGQLTLDGKLLLARPALDRKTDTSVQIQLSHSFTTSNVAVGSGSIGHYGNVHSKCLCCPAPIVNGQIRPLCDNCLAAPDAAERRRAAASRLGERWGALQTTFTELWTNCIKCQTVGAVKELRTCENLDCPQFFRRTVVKKDLERVSLKLSLAGGWLLPAPVCVQQSIQ